jgi:polysaccharide pyruvyl transferase WcaK-like protein
LPIGTITDSLSVPTSVEDFDSDGFWEYYKERHGKVIDEIKKSNVIVVNGEGSLHGLAPLPLKLLYLMYIAKKRLNTSTYLLNHSCYPDEDKKLPAGLGAFLYKKVYTEIDFCGIREIKSSQILRELGLAITDTFDCLPLYIERNFTSAIEGDENSIVIAGSVFIDDGVLSILSTCIDNLSSRGYKIKLLIGADAFPAADDLRFFSALKRMCPDSFQLINANSEKEWLATIDQARLLISGRFHHSIAAAFLKTPFVALQTNTPKLDALLEMLSLPWKLSVTDNNASELLMEMVDLLLLSPGRGIVDDSVCDELKRRSLVNFIDL